ncbi:hypothetical protein BJV77DRAFT_1034714 [Russula vinacea]|nr:hypothetical protein BJV77DRAFT_1034714 [Russula vinacea]
MPLVPVRSPVGPRSVTDQMETQVLKPQREASGHILSLGSTYSDSSLRRSGRDCARDLKRMICTFSLSTVSTSVNGFFCTRIISATYINDILEFGLNISVQEHLNIVEGSKYAERLEKKKRSWTWRSRADRAGSLFPPSSMSLMSCESQPCVKEIWYPHDK